MEVIEFIKKMFNVELTEEQIEIVNQLIENQNYNEFYYQ
jgi:hypothetical protein